jgi:hypothetical protein
MSVPMPPSGGGLKGGYGGSDNTSMMGGGAKKSPSFFQYVFNFDDDNKSAMLNMVQYAVLAIIPVLLLLKGIKHLIPDEDDSKGSLEILAESIGQIIIMMLVIWFINKVIQFIPTYSGEAYQPFNETSFIIPFVLILATMQTKLGAKFNILIDRLMDLWHGKTSQPPAQQQQQGGSGGQVRVTQPLAQMHQPSQADYLDRTQLLPSSSHLTQMPAAQPVRQQPDYNMVGQQFMAPEPSAANEMGGSWSSW